MSIRVNLLELIEAMNSGHDALEKLAVKYGTSAREILRALDEGRWRLC